MGIESEMQPTYSLALGSWEVNLLELTNAYGTLANKGVYEKGHGIAQIRDRQGNIIYQADFPSAKVIDPDTAAMMTWMLEGVVRSPNRNTSPNWQTFGGKNRNIRRISRSLVHGLHTPSNRRNLAW